MSPHALFRSDKAKYAPNFTGKSIAPGGQLVETVTYAAERKATLLGLFSTQISYRMCRPYLEAIESGLGKEDVTAILHQITLSSATIHP